MEMFDFIPYAAVGLAIVITEIYKNLGFIPPEVVRKTIWIPPLVVGIVYGMLTKWGLPWNEIVKEIIFCSAGSVYAVLIAKRTIKMEKK